jgi:hypothetical protein
MGMSNAGTDGAQAGVEWEPDLFEMANLYPRTTGLPMTVLASPRGHAQNDARIKVCQTPGNRMDADDAAVVAVRPQPRLLHGDLPPGDLAAVLDWVARNAPALVAYWDGAIDTAEFIERLQRI